MIKKIKNRRTRLLLRENLINLIGDEARFARQLRIIDEVFAEATDSQVLALLDIQGFLLNLNQFKKAETDRLTGRQARKIRQLESEVRRLENELNRRS